MWLITNVAKLYPIEFSLVIAQYLSLNYENKFNIFLTKFSTEFTQLQAQFYVSIFK